MTTFKRWLERRMRRRNLPFILAVIGLGLVIVMLMIYSPHTDSGNSRRDPSIVATDRSSSNRRTAVPNRDSTASSHNHYAARYIDESGKAVLLLLSHAQENREARKADFDWDRREKHADLVLHLRGGPW